MIVNPAKRIFSAISLGVFCREAPSTNLIMRSRKVSPGFDVMRTLISSESTRVPPVTAERSPPHSRRQHLQNAVSNSALPLLSHPLASDGPASRLVPSAASLLEPFHGPRPSLPQSSRTAP